MTDGGEILYVGCYTGDSGGAGDGIVALYRDPVSGGLSTIGTVAESPSPSFLARHPALPVLYAVNELDDGAISAWAIDGASTLRWLATRRTGGAGPCHLAVTPDGRYLVTANYGGGSIAVHPLDGAGVPGERSDLLVHDRPEADTSDRPASADRPISADRRLSGRQRAPHAHMISPGPDDQPLLAVDLGTDSIYRYGPLGAAGRLLPSGPRLRTARGTGPRHLARHPDGRRCYLVGELNATVTAYDLKPDGDLRERGRVSASVESGHVQPSELAVRADGRFLYVANRGVDTLAVFALDQPTPRHVAEISTAGCWPRHFALIGEHLYVANERSHSVTAFYVEPETGVPVPAGRPVRTASPTCVISGRWR